MNWPSDYPLLLRAADLTDGHSVGIRHFVGDLQSMPGALEIGAFYFQDENLIYLRGRRLISFSQPPKKTLYNYSTAFKHPFIDKVRYCSGWPNTSSEGIHIRNRQPSFCF